MTVPVPATREEAKDARYPLTEDLSPDGRTVRLVLREGFDAGYAAGLRRAAEIAREMYPLGSQVLGDAPDVIARRIEAEADRDR